MEKGITDLTLLVPEEVDGWRASQKDGFFNPDNLPESDPSAMSFGSGGNAGPKVWKDIWGAGQGVGSIKKVQGVGAYVNELAAQYEAAKSRICGG